MIAGSCLQATSPSTSTIAADSRTDLRSMGLNLRLRCGLDATLEFRVTAGAVCHLALQLAARGIDVFTTGTANHRLHAGIQQDGLEVADDRLVRTLVLRARERIEWNQVHLARQAAHQLDQLL